MTKRVFLGGRPLSDFCAKLATNYAITGYETENIYAKSPGRSAFSLIAQNRGLLTLKLPIDILGRDKAHAMACMAALNAQLDGVVEVDLGDGFAYTCMLSEIGETQWLSDAFCTADYTLLGLRHGQDLCILGTAPLQLHNAGSWPKTDCRITIRNFAITDTPISLHLVHAGKPYLSWEIDTAGGVFSGGDLVLDGLKQRNRYGSGSVPAGAMRWSDYPYLLPGDNTVTASGLPHDAVIEIDYAPAYL